MEETEILDNIYRIAQILSDFATCSLEINCIKKKEIFRKIYRAKICFNYPSVYFDSSPICSKKHVKLQDLFKEIEMLIREKIPKK